MSSDTTQGTRPGFLAPSPLPSRATTSFPSPSFPLVSFLALSSCLSPSCVCHLRMLRRQNWDTDTTTQSIERVSSESRMWPIPSFSFFLFLSREFRCLLVLFFVCYQSLLFLLLLHLSSACRWGSRGGPTLWPWATGLRTYAGSRIRGVPHWKMWARAQIFFSRHLIIMKLRSFSILRVI